MLIARRKTDSSAPMLMFNTVIFGVAVGLVGYCWLLVSKSGIDVTPHVFGLWSRQEMLLLSTMAVLLAGLFHSIVIVYPQFRQTEEAQMKANLLVDDFKSQAMRDPLTGIQNRRYFDNALDAYIKEFSTHRAMFGLLILDLDHFKLINDTHGHDAGDLVLKEVAICLNQISREHDIVARIGGEEFAAIIPVANQAELVAAAERYRRTIGELKIDYGDEPIEITVSVGVATNQEGKAVADLFKLADEHLYLAKRNGRNCVVA